MQFHGIGVGEFAELDPDKNSNAFLLREADLFQRFTSNHALVNSGHSSSLRDSISCSANPASLAARMMRFWYSVGIDNL